MSKMVGNLLRAVFVILLCAGGATQAQQKPGQPSASYPNKTVRIIVGSSPGGGSDITARLVAQKLAELWGSSVVVENRSAGAVYGFEAIARATPDGYSIALVPSSGYSAAVLSIKVPFDIKKDIEPLAQLTSQPYVMVIHPSLPVGSVKELIAYAKSKPGVINYGSTGAGTASHLGMELLKSMIAVDVVHIPYKGAGPAYIALISGEVQVFLGSAVSSMQHVKSGKMKALAVTTAERSKFLPDLPTISESGVPGFELSGWYGLALPAGVAPAIVRKIHQAVQHALRSPEIQAKLAATGSEVKLSASPAEFKNVTAREIDKWEKFRKMSGIKF